MNDTANVLDDLVSALDRRTRGLTGRQFENMVSPAMAVAFVRAWLTLGRKPQDIPGEWQDLADTFTDIG